MVHGPGARGSLLQQRHVTGQQFPQETVQPVLCTATNKGDVIVEFRGALVYLSQDRRRYGHLDKLWVRIPSQIDLGLMDLTDHGRKVVSLVARFLCLDWRRGPHHDTTPLEDGHPRDWNVGPPPRPR